MTIRELKRYVNENNKIEEILIALGCHSIRDFGDKIVCANPDGDNKTAINVYKNEFLKVIDWTRDEEIKRLNLYPDLLTLIMYCKNLKFYEAFVWLHDFLGLELTYNTENIEEVKDDFELDLKNIFPSHWLKERTKKEYDPLSENLLLDYCKYPHIDFIIDACLSEDTITKFGIGYSYNAQRTIIPIRHWYDKNNNIMIGIRGRTSIKDYKELGIPKYFPLRAYSTSGTLYGLCENMENIKRTQRVIIYEAEKSVLKTDSLNKAIQKYSEDLEVEYYYLDYKNRIPHEEKEEDPGDKKPGDKKEEKIKETYELYGVALCGHNLSEDQRDILSELSLAEYIIALDNDISESEIHAMCEKFLPCKNVSYIRDTEGILGEKDSPIDASIPDFCRLLKNRIRYTPEMHEQYIKNQNKNKVGE